ncbi:Fc.00g002960.m01.CDS01 [Cosmosporella sp. VM-42]
MSLYQRPSANTGKRATTTAQPGSFYYDAQQVPHPPADRVHAAAVEDYDSDLLDHLNKANTDLNKANAEKDKLKAALELATKKLNESAAAYRELKAQHEGVRTENDVLKDDIRQLKDDNSRLDFERRDAEQRFIGLNAKHENLTLKYNALSGVVPPSSMTSPLPSDTDRPERPERNERTDRPERPKVSSRPSSKASSGKSSSSSKTPSKKDREERERHREERHRDREDRHREKEDRHREKSRPRDKERDREHKSEAKADKVRLSKRFDERPAPANRRASFIEPWGPGGRMQTAAVTQSHQAPYANNVPRTANANVTLPGHFSSDSSAFDDDTYEDGSYHPYPIVN